MHNKTDKASYQGRKRGNRLGFWFFETLARLSGLKGAYGLLYGVCLHYLLFDREATGNARAYVRRRFPEASAVRQYLHVYRLFLSQGKQLIDRYVEISGHHIFNFDFKGAEAFDAILNDPGQGFILLTSHQGNWQIAMNALGNIPKKINLLMRPEETPAVQESLRLQNVTDQINIVSPDSYMGGVVTLMNALKDGEVVSIMGDRSYGADTVAIDFLGETAAFPYSAFHMAAVAKVPIIILLCHKTSDYDYLVDLSQIMRPTYRSRKNKMAQIQPWVQKYASLLETQLAEFPYECFLFYDVWAEATAKQAAAE